MIDKNSVTSYQGEGEIPPAPISLPPLPDVSNYGMDGTVWPDIQTPIYGSEDIQAQPPFIDADIGALRNNPGEYFKVFYNPKGNGAWPQLRFTQGLIVEGTELSRVGSVTYSAVDGNPVKGHTAGRNPTNKTVWLNVTNDRSASSVSLNKDSSADFSFELARIDGNGNIQQLHSGALVIGGEGGGPSQWKIGVEVLNPSTGQTRITCDPNGATVMNDKYQNVPITPATLSSLQNVQNGDKYVVYVEYRYGYNYTTTVKEQALLQCSKYTAPTGNNKDMRFMVQQMLSDTISEGRSRQVIALLTFSKTGSGSTSVISHKVTQITFHSLRQVWIPGYWEKAASTQEIKHGAACFLDVSSSNGMSNFPAI